MLCRCCYRKARAASAQSFTLWVWWQQATIEIMRRNHSSRTLVIMFNRSQVSTGKDSTPQSLYYCLFAPRISGCYSSRTSRSWWTAHLTQRRRRGCNRVAQSEPEFFGWNRSRIFLSDSGCPIGSFFTSTLQNWEFLLKWCIFFWKICWNRDFLLCTTISIDFNSQISFPLC